MPSALPSRACSCARSGLFPCLGACSRPPTLHLLSGRATRAQLRGANKYIPLAGNPAIYRFCKTGDPQRAFAEFKQLLIDNGCEEAAVEITQAYFLVFPKYNRQMGEAWVSVQRSQALTLANLTKQMNIAKEMDTWKRSHPAQAFSGFYALAGNKEMYEKVYLKLEELLAKPPIAALCEVYTTPAGGTYSEHTFCSAAILFNLLACLVLDGGYTLSREVRVALHHVGCVFGKMKVAGAGHEGDIPATFGGHAAGICPLPPEGADARNLRALIGNYVGTGALNRGSKGVMFILGDVLGNPEDVEISERVLDAAPPLVVELPAVDLGRATYWFAGLSATQRAGFDYLSLAKEEHPLYWGEHGLCRLLYDRNEAAGMHKGKSVPQAISSVASACKHVFSGASCTFWGCSPVFVSPGGDLCADNAKADELKSCPPAYLKKRYGIARGGALRRKVPGPIDEEGCVARNFGGATQRWMPNRWFELTGTPKL